MHHASGPQSRDGSEPVGGVDVARQWALDPAVTFLNHGSFGACPTPVLERQAEWRARMEREPVRFLDRELEGLLDEARTELGAFLSADVEGLSFVRNATSGVNAVLGSIDLAPGDEILATDHEYNATLATLERRAVTMAARVRLVHIPFPDPGTPDDVVAAVVSAVSERTRLVVVSHVTSPTGLVLPVPALVDALRARGVAVLVDGAHAPGMLDLRLDALAPDWYVGNLHKWVCAPKGAAFVWARRDRRIGLRPAITSHGANDPRSHRSRYRLEFDWTGTDDPSPWLTVPDALRFLERLRPGGLAELQRRQRDLARQARDRLCEALAIAPPVPDELLGAMPAVPLPIARDDERRARALQAALFDHDGIEVPITDWPVRGARPIGSPPAVWSVRVSVAPYTSPADVERLVDALGRQLGRTLSPAARSGAGPATRLAPPGGG